MSSIKETIGRKVTSLSGKRFGMKEAVYLVELFSKIEIEIDAIEKRSPEV